MRITIISRARKIIPIISDMHYNSSKNYGVHLGGRYIYNNLYFEQNTLRNAIFQKNLNMTKDVKNLVMGGERCISYSSVKSSVKQYKSKNMQLLWIDTNPCLKIKQTRMESKFSNESILLQLFNYEQDWPIKQYPLLPHNTYIYGVDSFTKQEEQIIVNENINIIHKNIFTDNMPLSNPLHISISMNALKNKYYPSQYIENKNGIHPNAIIDIFKTYKKNIVGVDICDFNPYACDRTTNIQSIYFINDFLKELF
jgi:arginase family enzyme